jgi:chromosome segregation ATPase
MSPPNENALADLLRNLQAHYDMIYGFNSRATNNYEQLQARYNTLLRRIQNDKKKFDELQAQYADVSV